MLGPALDQAGEESAATANHALIPKIVVVPEPLSVGVVGAGIALADLMDQGRSDGLGALGISTLISLVGFGPLHVLATRVAVELSMPDPDGERIDDLFGKTVQWGLVQTVLMLAVVVGIRWGI